MSPTKKHQARIRELRNDLLEGAADPILTFAFICADMGCSPATFYRRSE